MLLSDLLQSTDNAARSTDRSRAYFNLPTGMDVLGDLKSVLEGLVTHA